MAVNVGTIEAVLRLKDQFSLGMKTAAKNAESAGKRLKSVSASARGIGKSLTMGVTLPLVGAAVAAVKFSQDLNKGMANVASLIPGNIDRVKELKASVQDLAIATGSSTGDMADGLYQVISAFGDSSDTVKILELNARAAAAGLATVTDAISLTSAVTKGYGDTSAGAASKVSDLAFTAVKLGQTTFPELAASMGRVVPLSAELKISQEELFAVMATATGVTGKAAEVSTQLRGVLQGLLAPTAEMSELYERMEVSSGHALIAQEGLQGALRMITDAAKASGQPLQKFIASIEGQTLALALSGPQAEVLTQKLAAMEDAVGATDEAFDEQTKGINAAGFAWNQLKSELLVVAQQLGDELQPVFNDIVRSVKDDIVPAVKEWIEWFRELDSESKKNYLQLAALLVVLPPLIFMFGAIGAGVSGVISMVVAIKALTAGTWLATAAAKGFTVAFWATPIVGWIAAIVAAGIAIYIFRDRIWNIVKGAFYAFLNVIDELKHKLGMLTSEELRAGKASRSLAEDLGDITPSVEVLTEALGQAALTGTVEDLHAAMANLGGQTSFSKETMDLIGEAAIRLRDAGQELTPALEQVADHLVRQQKAAKEAAEKIEDLAERSEALTAAQLEAAEAAEAFKEDVQALSDSFSGAGLIKQVSLLETAYSELTPELTGNERHMREMSKAALELRDSGMELSDGLDDLADSAHASKEGVLEFNAAVEKAKDIQGIMDDLTGRDVVDSVNNLQQAWTNLSDSQRANTATLRIARDAIKQIEESGGEFTGTLRDLDTTVVDVEDSTAAFVKRVQDLQKKLGKDGLQEDAAVLGVSLEGMREKGDLTAFAMEELGKEALKLREAGAKLSDELNAMADSAERAAAESKGLGGSWLDLLDTMAESFERLSNIAGGKFGGIAKAFGTIVGSVQLAGESTTALVGGFKQVESGGENLTSGLASITTGVIGMISAMDAATSSGSKLQNVLGGLATGAQIGAQIGSMIGPIGGALGAGIGAIAGGIVGMFRGGSEEKANKQIVWIKKKVLSLHGSLEQVRETAGKAGEALYYAWSGTGAGGLANLQQKLAEFNAALAETAAEAAEVERVTVETIDGLRELANQGRETGEILPSHLEPYLAKLIELGLLTQADQALLMQMANDANVNWQDMQSAAERYGVSLSALGPAFDSARLQDAAQAIAADWDMLNQEGVDTNAVLAGMSESVQALIDDAADAGVDIPASLQPIIAKMIEQGLLTDENGAKLTSLGDLDFAEELTEKFSALIDKISELIDKLTETRTAAEDIPTDISIRVGYEVDKFELPDFGDLVSGVPIDFNPLSTMSPEEIQRLYDQVQPQGFAGGTDGKFVDFGKGTLAMLHGKEAIVPQSKAANFSSSNGEDANAALLLEVSGLRREIHNLPLHLRDAILLTR